MAWFFLKTRWKSAGFNSLAARGRIALATAVAGWLAGTLLDTSGSRDRQSRGSNASGRQPLPTLCAAGLDDGAAGTGRHASTETVSTLTL